MENKYFNNDPLSQFYNLNELDSVILTCDVDWAPDYAVKSVIELIGKYGFKINIFATHKSEVLQQKFNHVNVGLHPDFTRPSQKDWFDKKILNLKEIYPNSKGMRSHRNFFGQNIGDLAYQAGLKYDVSFFLWNEPYCQAHIDYNGMVRFSYFWEDGIHLDLNKPFDVNSINLDSPGLKILNIHPILFYLNSDSEDHRRAVTSRYSNLTIAPKFEIDRDINRKYGIQNFYKEILNYLKTKNVKTYFLEELTDIKLNTNFSLPKMSSGI